MKRSRLWFIIHSWLGLNLSIFMTFVLVTGTLAVLSDEMDWAAHPEMRVAPQSAENRISWGAVYDAARTAYPEGRLTGIHWRDDPWFAVEVSMRTPWEERVRLWVNPYSGEAQGITGWFNFQRFFRQAHRHLMLPVAIGVPVVCALSFVLIASLVTGLLVYKKFWRGFFKWPRFGCGARTLTGDLHRLGGLWSLWFVALIGLTGVWYLVEEWGGRAPGFPQPAPPPAMDEVTTADGAALDRAVAAAQDAFPDLKIQSAQFPGEGNRVVTFQGQAEAWLVRRRANTVTIDTASGRRLGQYRGEALTAHQRISEMADPLHFGTWGGLASRVLWFLFGAVMSGLSITGVLIYGLRARRSVTGLAGASAARKAAE